MITRNSYEVKTMSEKTIIIKVKTDVPLHGVNANASSNVGVESDGSPVKRK